MHSAGEAPTRHTNIRCDHDVYKIYNPRGWMKKKKKKKGESSRLQSRETSGPPKAKWPALFHDGMEYRGPHKNAARVNKPRERRWRWRAYLAMRSDNMEDKKRKKKNQPNSNKTKKKKKNRFNELLTISLSISLSLFLFYTGREENNNTIGYAHMSCRKSVSRKVVPQQTFSVISPRSIAKKQKIQQGNWYQNKRKDLITLSLF